MNILHVGSCEVGEIRHSADAVGYSCPRTASTQCSDCGSELCESHTQTCDGCRSVFCPALLFLPSSTALEARARGTSGAKERLAGVPSRRKNNSQGRHNAGAAAWLQSQRKRDASCSSPPLDSANLWC